MKINYPKVQIDEDDNLVRLKSEQLLSFNSSGCTISERIDGLLANKSFFLPHDYDWIIVKDDQNQPCLVPRKKESAK